MSARITSFLGKPICTDRLTKDCRRLDVAKLCVLMNMDSDFPMEIPMHSGNSARKFNLKVEYEWVSEKCKVCGTFSHEGEACNFDKQQPVKAEVLAVPLILLSPPLGVQHDMTIVARLQSSAVVEEVTTEISATPVRHDQRVDNESSFTEVVRKKAAKKTQA